jgi:PBP1b-binding outer membrane lipoprotein LpoB
MALFNVVLLQECVAWMETKQEIEAATEEEALEIAKNSRESFDDLSWETYHYEPTGRERYTVA